MRNKLCNFAVNLYFEELIHQDNDDGKFGQDFEGRSRFGNHTDLHGTSVGILLLGMNDSD